MKLLYLYRQRNSGFSIEGLFAGLTDYLRQNSAYQIAEAYAPRRTLSFSCLYQNIRFAARQRADIFHITGDAHYLMLALPTRRTVLTIHDCVSLKTQLSAGNQLNFRILWLLYYYLPMRLARYITTVSEKSREELRHFMGAGLADKVVVIPNAYDPAFVFAPRPFNADRPTLLHIGTAPHKNLSRLLEAVEGLPLTLLIVGNLSATETGALRRHQITYEHHTNLGQEALLKLYYRCDIVTFVSLYEGFGMPVLEGQAVGRAVLTSALSPMTEVGGAGACYVDPLSVADIRRGLLRLWHDESYRQELIRAGRANADLYTIEHISARYVALYHTLQTGH